MIAWRAVGISALDEMSDEQLDETVEEALLSVDVEQGELVQTSSDTESAAKNHSREVGREERGMYGKEASAHRPRAN